MSEPSKHFRVAFSFAGEKRDFVQKLAGLLAIEFGKKAILYDKYHEADFAHIDLGIELPDLYHKAADLVVLVICRDYESKEWCGLEWRAIHALIKERGGDGVMLCRFDHALIKGIYSNAGFIELDGRTAEEIMPLILERLAAVDRRQAEAQVALVAQSPKPPTTSIPHNLPSLQPFFGREEELAKIADALAPDTRGWGALIDGPGGMGKTSLAVRAAYDASPEVFQKIIFVSLKTRELDDDGLRDLSGFILSGLAELFGELARELGRPEILKSAEDQRPRLLLDALRGTQTLLLLDNLESLLKRERDTVFTFVNKLPAGCKAILTSRGRIGSGAQELILEKLSEAAALATLAELATHNPLLAQTSKAERLVLYRETGGKPLLLRWTAGQLGRGHCLTFTDAIAHLRSCPEGNDPLEFIFGDLVEDFTEAETRVLCALTYFTLPAKVEHLAPLAELLQPEADRALRSLTVRSLAVPNTDLQTFTLVPLVADFLRKVKPEVVKETGSQLGKRAYALIVENGHAELERFPVLSAAWPTIAAALPLFVAGPNETLQTACNALDAFLEFSGRWDDWLSLSQQAEPKAVAAGDFFRAGWRAFQAGWVYKQRREADLVLAHATRAAEYWKDLPANDRTVRARAHAIRLRGHWYQLRGNYAEAAALYREALEWFRNVKSDSSRIIALNDLAKVERLSGDYEASERDSREAKQLALGLPRPSREHNADATGNLAQLALDREDWPGAESLAREALHLSEAIERQAFVAAHCIQLATALARQGKAAEGQPYAQRAVAIYTRLGSPDLRAALSSLVACRAALLVGLQPGWTYNTTALEGSSLTLAEVSQALADPSARFENRPPEHVAAARGQHEANRTIARWLREMRDFTKEDLFALHTIIMQGSVVDSLSPIGAWKCEDNGTPVEFEGKTRWNDTYAAPRYVGALMEQWLTEFNQRREGSSHPFESYLWLHATFVRIHPFADGNGRLARLLANVPLICCGEPMVDIPALAKRRYRGALARWQFASGNPVPGTPLYNHEDDLKDFIELCRESQMPRAVETLAAAADVNSKP